MVPSKVEEAPSWDRIAVALKVLLARFDVDLSRIGKSQRLDYEDFETIFYSLFQLIDPIETRKRFRSISGAARNPEERTKFIELCSRYLNDEQMVPQRVTTSQLRILGGEPFRRLLEALIKTACARELERLGPEDEDAAADSPNSELSPAEIAEKLKKESTRMQEDMANYRDSLEKLRQLKQQVAESNRKVAASVNRYQHQSMSSLDDASNSSCTSSIRYDTSTIVRSLLSRLEVSHKQTKVALDKINAIELPREVAETAASAGRKRLSQFIRETASKFDTSQELEEVSRTRLNEKLRQQLVNYDQGVERLLESWRNEEEKRDEEMLKDPEVQAMYVQLEKLLPMINLEPIRVINSEQQTPENSAKETSPVPPSLEFIKEILSLYPDDKYDDQEILEHSKKFFK